MRQPLAPRLPQRSVIAAPPAEEHDVGIPTSSRGWLINHSEKSMSQKFMVNLAPVLTFMVAARQIQPDHPGSYSTLPSINTAVKTLDFIESELKELRDALQQYRAAPNPSMLAEVAKELADVLYTAANVAVAMNLPIGEIFGAVADSNTSKFLPCSCEDGCSVCVWTGLVSADRSTFKVPKGPNYRPADDAILAILRKHRRIQ